MLQIRDLTVTMKKDLRDLLRGFTFARMDIQRSHAVHFLIDREARALIPPFTSVDGLGETVAWDIMEKREGKEFISIEEFSMACTKASSSHIAQLKDAGAFGNMPDSSQFSLF